MTPAARLQATLELLEQINTTPRPADALVSAYFRGRRYIGSHDRAALSTRLYTVMRHHARLNWWLNKYDVLPQARAHLLAWMMLGETTSAAQLSELCSGGKFAPAALSEEEKIWLKRLQGSTLEHPDMPESVLAECPDIHVQALRQKFGPRFLPELRAMQAPAALDLRVNTVKATREAVFEALTQQGLKPELCAYSPWGIRLHDRPALGNLQLLQDGLIEIQDEGSQLVALAVDAKPGERIADFCAGAGGKTLALGAMMENKGRITALDVMESRLKKGSERFSRAGLFNIQTRLLASENDAWVKKHKGSFDRVLVDAPCTGTGTWRRNPDARWRALGPGLEQLAPSQASILSHAARLVKPGGRLVYSTCSLLAEENERQIEAFLATHADFAPAPCGLDGALYLALTPAQHGTDGFFAAALVKNSQA